MKKLYKLSLISSAFILGACDQVKNFSDQKKQELVAKLEQKMNEKMRELTEQEEQNAEALYIAIRDKDVATIEKLLEPKAYQEMQDDETSLLELSSYIPYYDPLLKKERISFGNQYYVGEGHFVIATYLYDYGKSQNRYTVTFRADQTQKNIAGINIHRTFYSSQMKFN
ncbi:hypothetical protein ABFP33_08985 [Acinetobacter bereziniae]|uniref:hypothetical protein n=1 Tax=Acinetobacter bereziniae TaxID=106648 RepID=UPI0032141BC6